MKAIIKQGQHFSGNHLNVAPVLRTLRSMSARSASGNTGWTRNNHVGGSSSQKKFTNFPGSLRIAVRHESESVSANDETIERLKNTFVESGAILPAPQDTPDERALYVRKALSLNSGFTGSLSPEHPHAFEHPLVMSYVSSCQPDQCMIYVSPQISQLGFAAETWLGETDFRLQQVHEDDLERVTRALQHTHSTGEKFDCQYRLYDSCGKVRWIHDEARVYEESGKPLFVRGVMLDVTDKKEMEAELNEHRYYLERNVEQRTERLMKRIAVLEQCNAALCDKLALARRESIAQKCFSVEQIVWPEESAVDFAAVSQPMPRPQTNQIEPTNDCIDQMNDISDWARNMIRLRLVAAGVIA